MYEHFWPLWLLYGILVTIYISRMSDEQIKKAKPTSEGLLIVVGGPTVWIILILGLIEARWRKEEKGGDA